MIYWFLYPLHTKLSVLNVLRYVPFRELLDPETLRAAVRFVREGSDFQKLARFLETRVDARWTPGRRTEGER